VLIVKGDALARIAQSIEIKRMVLGDGPRGPGDVPGRLMVVLEELDVDFSLGEKREPDMRHGIGLAAWGFASEVAFPSSPGLLTGDAPPLAGETPMITSLDPLLPRLLLSVSRSSNLIRCHGLMCEYQMYWHTKAISTVT